MPCSRRELEVLAAYGVLDERLGVVPGALAEMSAGYAEALCPSEEAPCRDPLVEALECLVSSECAREVAGLVRGAQGH